MHIFEDRTPSTRQPECDEIWHATFFCGSTNTCSVTSWIFESWVFLEKNYDENVLRKNSRTIF